MDLQSLLSNMPKVHEREGREGQGDFVFYGLSRAVLEFIDSHVDGNAKTLETGSGMSTVLFAMKHSAHICITPSQVETERIRDYCARHGISSDRVDFRIDRSDNVLPHLEVEDLDLALIDGCHGFPTPFLDWHFLAPRLKVGGVMIIDDTQLCTGHLLKEFVLCEPEWERIWPLSERTAIFRKLRSYNASKEWTQQPYMVRWGERRSKPPSKLQQGMQLVREGQLLTLAQKVAKQITG